MRKILFPVVCCAVLAVTTGCDKTREALGLKRTQADEFDVLDRAPLSYPPEYALRPPLPKNQTSDAKKERDAVQASILGQKKTVNDTRSNSEVHLLEQSGVAHADKHVREKLAKEIPAKPEIAPGEALLSGVGIKNNRTQGDIIDPQQENLRYNGHTMPQAAINKP